MKPDLCILKLFLTYSQYINYNTYVSERDFSDELRIIYSCIVKYYRDHSDNLSVPSLSLLVFSNQVKDKDFYEGVLDTIDKLEVDESLTIEYINSLRKNKLLQDLSIASYEAANGQTDFSKVEDLISSLSQPSSLAVEEEYVSDNLEQLLSEVVLASGLRWRLQCLNKSLGSLRKGDFGFLFARPESGKTTFVASEGTYFAEQAKKQGLGPGLWINNEEVNKKVKLRTIQAALGVSLAALLANPKHYQKIYDETVGSHLLIPDKHTYNRTDIETLCAANKPSFLILDQIDKIEGFKADRPDLQLGAIYKWARDLANKYCPIIAVCQANGTGENVKWLTMGHVAEATTSKQAEADWILGIGKDNDPGWEAIRFLNISKNKLVGDSDSDPSMRHAKLECLIEPTIGRYKDL